MRLANATDTSQTENKELMGNVAAQIRKARNRADIFRAIAKKEGDIPYAWALRCIHKLAKMSPDCSRNESLFKFEQIGAQKLLDRVPNKIHSLSRSELSIIIGDILCLQATRGLDGPLDPGVKQHLINALRHAKEDMKKSLPASTL